jgi:Family of unknown function (DUF6335)
MAKRKARKRKRTSSAPSGRSTSRKGAKKAVSGKRPTRKSRPVRRITAKKKSAPARRAPVKKRSTPPPAARLDRVRRTLEETVQTPPSSLNMVRRGTAVRTGRAEIAESLEQHRGMSPDITGGDVDVDVEDAYFNGDEAPGGDNPTPDQDIVDDIGKALGVEYQDNEELKAVDKVTERDRKRWELDPASSEDYKER